MSIMASHLPSSADYLIIGGGTSGLVLASRLSEDPDVSIIVLESGPNATADARVQNPAAWPTLGGSDLDWKTKTEPQLGLNGRTTDHPAGKALGGSSAINGLVLTLPFAAGIDAWAKLGNEDWTWESFRPYLEKAIDLPSGSTTQSPIKTTYMSLIEGKRNPLAQAWSDAHGDLGYANTGCSINQEDSLGVRPMMGTIDPSSGNRSGADSTYGVVAAARPSVTIVTGATVRRISFSQGTEVTATGVEVVCSGSTVAVEVRKEAILAAGAFHTPKILELSGIGDEERLSDLGIPMVLHQPGVGQNLQNHVMGVVPVPLKESADLAGVQPGLQAIAFTSLDGEGVDSLLSKHLGHGTLDQVTRSLLEPLHQPSATSIMGLMSNKLALIVILLSTPSSRGSVHISSTDPDALPSIDPKYFSHDLDIEILARHVQAAQMLLASPTMEPFVQTGAGVLDVDTIKEKLSESMAAGANHACGTAAMLPREHGGVVGQDLKVYGTTNVRIVDASIFPLIPHGNPIATVYGVAERAADLVKGVQMSNRRGNDPAC
ncbi:hypothetical protein BJX99DRAFT_66761 [Aspergillus californicus]